LKISLSKRMDRGGEALFHRGASPRAGTLLAETVPCEWDGNRYDGAKIGPERRVHRAMAAIQRNCIDVSSLVRPMYPAPPTFRRAKTMP
jgi:hypothetical protein